MVDIADDINTATTVAMTETNTASTDLTRVARSSQQPGNHSTASTRHHQADTSPLHSMPSLYSGMMPQRITPKVNNSIRLTAHGLIPSIQIISTGVSIHALPTFTVPSGMVLPQLLLRTPPTKAFNFQQVIANMHFDKDLGKKKTRMANHWHVNTLHESNQPPETHQSSQQCTSTLASISSIRESANDS
ncbi:hypothetical protein TIFTF001_029962 [Ficus carica]|uniref:Uncharacterized protein n=1 Tax=Ficus carica TaxID=3494 RepID=A0AA88J259_FICCA|nr:hypothetical protein TIFTF001_029962 [Ficus carica]